MVAPLSPPNPTPPRLHQRSHASLGRSPPSVSIKRSMRDVDPMSTSRATDDGEGTSTGTSPTCVKEEDEGRLLSQRRRH
jgi:hypothetical protein